MESALLGFERFGDISLLDPFFDSLKLDYPGFEGWFKKKENEYAFTFRNYAGLLDGFLYLKLEDEGLVDVIPALPPSRRLKIGTFKINPHGTRLGERFLKRAFDIAVEQKVDALYVTVFEKHQALVDLFLRYGFVSRAIKPAAVGHELVLERRLDTVSGDVVFDYPRIPVVDGRHFILSLYPQWHSRLLPDSLLKTEDSSILEDVSHTNSIHKIYLTAMSGVYQLRRGDTLLIYRTAQGGSAYHTSVVTSLCVVEELLHLDNFRSEREFLEYCAPYSIFSEMELKRFFANRRYPWVIRFTYNMSLKRRPNRRALVEQLGFDPAMYWGFFKIPSQQLFGVLKLSGDDEKASSLIYPS